MPTNVPWRSRDSLRSLKRIPNTALHWNVGACHGLCENRINRAKSAPIPSLKSVRRPVSLGDKPSASALGLSPRVSSFACSTNPARLHATRSAYQAPSSRNVGYHSGSTTSPLQISHILLTRGVRQYGKPLRRGKSIMLTHEDTLTPEKYRE